MKELTAEQKRDWLTATADAMEAAGEEHFDMEHWFRTTTSSYHNLRDVDNVFDINECGTSACMAGWLTLTAPSDVKDVITSSDTPSLFLSETLGISYSAWYRESWHDLHCEYGGPYDELSPYEYRTDYASAIAFLRAVADTCSS